jgi:hypothetical protein
VYKFEAKDKQARRVSGRLASYNARRYKAATDGSIIGQPIGLGVA